MRMPNKILKDNKWRKCKCTESTEFTYIVKMIHWSHRCQRPSQRLQVKRPLLWNCCCSSIETHVNDTLSESKPTPHFEMTVDPNWCHCPPMFVWSSAAIVAPLWSANCSMMRTMASFALIWHQVAGKHHHGCGSSSATPQILVIRPTSPDIRLIETVIV